MKTKSKGAPALVFQSTQFNVIDRNGQQWLRGHQIGDALGYSKSKREGRPNAPFAERQLRRLYTRHAAEFSDSMTALVKLRTKGGPQEVRIFSLRGAHLLSMFARTEKAAEFRRWVLDILERETAPAVPAIPALPRAKYHYPRHMLDQPYFVLPATGKATLHLSMLANTTQFVSPLLALLNQLRSEGHDITAAFDEAVAMRTILQQTDKELETLVDIARRARFTGSGGTERK